MPFTPDPKLEKDHLEWLSGFDAQHVRNWKKLLNADPEAAMCEAAFRRLLADNGCEVQPNEDVTGKVPSPDFLCLKDESRFYVEVACIEIDTVTAKTNLANGTPLAGHHRSLNTTIFETVRGKLRQCINLDAPTLVAVGTFHWSSSILHFEKLDISWLLTGTIGAVFPFDTIRGEAATEAQAVTTLKNAAFVRPNDEGWIETTRHPVSGLLVAGLGTDRWRVFGVLHPEPKRPFDRELLPHIEFCRLIAGYKDGNFATEWI